MQHETHFMSSVFSLKSKHWLDWQLMGLAQMYHFFKRLALNADFVFPLIKTSAKKKKYWCSAFLVKDQHFCRLCSTYAEAGSVSSREVSWSAANPNGLSTSDRIVWQIGGLYHPKVQDLALFRQNQEVWFMIEDLDLEW